MSAEPPSELEAGLRNRLRDGGFTLGAGEGATIMTVRITMNNDAARLFTCGPNLLRRSS